MRVLFFFFFFGACTFVLMVPNTATLTGWKAPSWTELPQSTFIFIQKHKWPFLEAVILTTRVCVWLYVCVCVCVCEWLGKSRWPK